MSVYKKFDSIESVPGVFLPKQKLIYLLRNIYLNENILLRGPSGTGKTVISEKCANVLGRPFFYINLGSTQDPRITIFGNTQYDNEVGTVFYRSEFIDAIQTENAIILLDELSRAHPEAWNILLSVFDKNKRCLRIDEEKNTPLIKVANNVTFIATANIGQEYTSTRTIDRALYDRFRIIQLDFLSFDEEYAMIIENMYNSNILKDNHILDIHKLIKISNEIRFDYLKSNSVVSNYISPRVLIHCAELLVEGFDIINILELCIFSIFDESGMNSERMFVKQIAQNYADIGIDDDDTGGSNLFKIKS